MVERIFNGRGLVHQARTTLILSYPLRAAIGVTFFLLATALGAFVYIRLPFTPVPITLQTFFVLLSGALLARNLGSLSQVSYLVLGAAGLPIFSGAGGGLAHLGGPTGGYIVGFVVAAWLIGRLLQRDNPGFARIIVSMTAGSIVIYILGLAWLMLVTRCSLDVGITLGVAPFLPGDALKVILAASLALKLMPRTKELFLG